MYTLVMNNIYTVNSNSFNFVENSIGCVMVSVFVSSVVDRGFYKTIHLIFASSPLSTQSGWLGLMMMCPSRATCLSFGLLFQ